MRHYFTCWLICLFQISQRSLPKVSKKISPYRDGNVNIAYLIKKKKKELPLILNSWRKKRNKKLHSHLHFDTVQEYPTCTKKEHTNCGTAEKTQLD